MKKIQVRTGVFETNSSSTHSITMCSPEDWKALEEGTCTNETLIEHYESYIDYNENGDLETYCYEKTTPKGEQVVLFGYYGYNG